MRANGIRKAVLQSISIFLVLDIILECESQSATYQKFTGFSLQPIPAAQNLVTHQANPTDKVICINLCTRDPLCSAAQFQETLRHCDLIRYARILLSADSNYSVYGKGVFLS